MKPGGCGVSSGLRLMTTAAVLGDPRIVHSLVGRVRVHLPAWDTGAEGWVAHKLRSLPGVSKVNANRLTRNVLVHFDPCVTDQKGILNSLANIGTPPADAQHQAWKIPAVQPERRGELQRVRIPVPGLDSNPVMAQELEDHLETLPGVRARASALTGRILVEWSSSDVTVDDLRAEISKVDLELPQQDREAGHPLDRGPLMQGVARLGGASLGLGFLATRRMLWLPGPPVSSTIPLIVADFVSVLRSFSLTRNGLRRLLGREATDTIFSSAQNLSLAAAGMPLGLALNQAEGLRQTTEAASRRSAWQRYESAVGGNFTLRPGAVVHAEAGEHFPFEAVVREGAGTAIGSNGLPLALVPGSIVPSGSPLYGGPFSLELRTPDRFTPEPRTAPEPDSFIRRYLRYSGMASIGYALARGLITRSPAQAYDALLMVNSRVALVGSEAANAGGAARVTRANGVVVGTRPERRVRLPDALIIDQPALLLRGYEVGDALVLSESHTQGDLLSLAKGVSVAAENPWGNLFPRIDSAEMTDGEFDGGNATARLDGVRYTLGPPDDAVSAAMKEPFHQRGEYLLALHSDLEPQPVGLITLHPRLSDDVRELVEVCEQHGVAVILLSEGDSVVAEALANRAGVMLAHGANAVSLIKALQSYRKVVAFVSDHANAGPGFAACDLAIGIANSNIEFPARADVLVPDLTGVAAVIDAGSRRNRAVRDSTFLSILTNVAGVVGGFFAQSFGRLAINITSVGALAALAVGWLRLKGGERSRSTTPLGDPMPERWGRRSTEDVLSALESRPTGLTSVEAAERYQQPPAPSRRHRLFDAVLEQLRSPIVGIMAGGGG